MTKDNEDAVRCANDMDQFLLTVPAHPLCTDGAAHLRRLVAENEALRESVKKANEQAEHFEREWYLRGDQNEAKDALLRQAVEAFFPWDCEESNHTQQYAALAAIRQHLKGRA